jgi:hypothetical protein
LQEPKRLLRKSFFCLKDRDVDKDYMTF